MILGVDEGGVDDGVVLVVPGLFVEGAAAGDQTQARVVDGPVDGFGGEKVFGIAVDGIDAEVGHAVVGAGDVDDLAGADVAEVEKDTGSLVGVDMADDHRRPGPEQPPRPGDWYWIDNTTVHYRPHRFWTPETTLTVTAKVYGLNLGGGVYGAEDHTATYLVHDSWIATADGVSEQMQIRHNGALVKTMPVSLGVLATPHAGIHVISGKQPSIVMDSCTYGVCPGRPGYYKETVRLDERNLCRCGTPTATGR